MKKTLAIISLISFMLFVNEAESQITQRTSGYSYFGLGYSLVGFTDGIVSDIYPFLDFRSGNFLTDLNVFYGYKPNNSVAFEISPSIIFTSATERNGYHYTENNTTGYHVPRDVRFLMIPVNFNVKYFPFGNMPLSFGSNIYLSAGGGMTYIREEYHNFVYSNSTRSLFLYSRTYEESKWVPDFQIGVGFTTPGVFAYGGEVSYRFVPVNPDNSTALALSRADNFNSINLTLKGIFSF